MREVRRAFHDAVVEVYG